MDFRSIALSALLFTAACTEEQAPESAAEASGEIRKAAEASAAEITSKANAMAAEVTKSANEMTAEINEVHSFPTRALPIWKSVV